MILPEAGRPGRAGRQAGQSLVELAIILPLLLWVLLGTLDFARAFHAKAAIANAVRVGAQFGMDARRPTADVVKVVVAEAAPTVVIQPDLVTATRAASSWGSGTDLTVAVQHDFQAVTPFVARIWGGGTLPLRASSTVRLLE